jgi:hypothetical protein
MERLMVDWIFVLIVGTLRGRFKGMSRLAVTLWIGVVAGCGTSGNLIGGDFIDSWADARDARPDPGEDPGIDPVPDAAPQEPFDFVLVNPTSEPMYVDWAFGSGGAILGYRAVESDLQTMLWYHPFCTLACSSIPAGECGCIDCAPPEPAVIEIPPSSEYRVAWEGPHVFALDTDRCGCACSIEELLADPTYGPHFVTAGVESYSEYECWGACAVDPDGVVHGAYASGERHCALADAGVPVEGDMVLVLGGAECWERW